MTKIQLCGLTNLADARFAAGAGADFLGFVQHEGSPRYVTPKAVAEIAEWLYGARTVGVFVNRSPDEVNRDATVAGFEFVQLHGDETPSMASELDFPVIKALRIEPGWTAADVEREASQWAGTAEYLLFDTWDPALYGGSGKHFDWSVLAGATIPLPWFLAGGLTPDTVKDAIGASAGTTAQETDVPFGVDVSSGVEEAPGRKDPEAINHFVQAVRTP